MSITRRNALIGASSIAIASAARPRISRGAEDEIKVASILDKSGGLAEWGDPMAKCMALAIEEINEKGGLNGKKITYIRYDTQSNDQLYAQYAAEAALQDKVSMVLGAITSASREVIRPILDRDKTLYVYTTGYEGGVCDLNTFCTGTEPTMVVRALIDWAVPALGKKVYIIAADYNAPHSTAKFIEAYTKEDGGEVVAQEYFPFEVSDFGNAISKIQAAKPDIIYSMLIGAPHLGFYRQWAASGMKDRIPIISNFFGGGNEEVLLAPEEGDGIVSCYGYWEDIDTPANKEFLARFAKRWGTNHPYINAIGMGAYEGMNMWRLGVEKAGTVERTKVIEALRSGVSWDGPAGHITIDPKTNAAIRDVYIARVKNRRMEIVKKVAQMAPTFTQQHCDLVAHPDTNKQYLP